MPLTELPPEYAEYLSKHVSPLEKTAEKLSGMDERLDYVVKLLTAMLELQAKAFGIKPSISGLPPSYQSLPTYNVRKMLLDTATTDQELEMDGDYIALYTDGSYAGITYKIHESNADPISAGEFNYYYGQFRKIYLSWTAQAGKYLRVFVGRGEQYRYKGT